MSLQMFISTVFSLIKVEVFSTEDLKSLLIYTGHNLTMITWTIYTLDFEKKTSCRYAEIVAHIQNRKVPYRNINIQSISDKNL